MRPHLAASVTAATLLLLTACGAADPGAAARAGDGVSSPDAGGAAGACLEGATDCVDAVLDAEAPVDELGFDLEAARRDAASLLGQGEDEVLELWGDVRVGRHGDERFALTEDLQPGRKTIATEDDGTGTYRVVEVTLETLAGPETFTAP
jgi:hypothetical protein